MGILTRRYKMSRAILSLLALLYALPMPAAASDAPPALEPFTLNARYRLAWNGIGVGRLVVVVRETADSYEMLVDTKTQGIASLISDDKTVTRTTGRKTPEGDYHITRYEFRPVGTHDDDYITLDYDAQGKIAKRVRTKDDDPRWRPAVPFAQIDTALDPLTGIFMLRRALYNAVATNQPRVETRIYDGMRLFNVTLTRREATRIEIMDRPTAVIPVALIRTPIDGYTPKETKKYKKGDPEIYFYFSNDAAFLPVRATADTGFGDLTLELVKRE